MIDLASITQRMGHHLTVIEALFADVSDEQARWRPSDDDWSMVEVIHHLADEEREDFRTRLILTLFYPEQAWPPIHPGAWVTERQYQARDADSGLQRFCHARLDSIQWLQGLQNPDWKRTVQRSFGAVSAGDLMASWLAHDLLHIRQLNELHYLWHQEQCAPFLPHYAGDW